MNPTPSQRRVALDCSLWDARGGKCAKNRSDVCDSYAV
jgi:hypothetical protein